MWKNLKVLYNPLFLSTAVGNRATEIRAKIERDFMDRPITSKILINNNLLPYVVKIASLREIITEI